MRKQSRPGIPSGGTQPIKLPRSYKRPRWHLGIRSQSHPQNIMQEIMKKLKVLNFEWKVVTPYYLRCRYVHPSLGFEVKQDLHLYQIDQRNYLLDFKEVDPVSGWSEDDGEWNEEEEQRASHEQSEDQQKRHYMMEFFEACSSLISALAQ